MAAALPVSGRRRFNYYGDGGGSVVEQQVKRIEYEVERQGGSFLPEWDPRTKMVKKVMRRLIPVSGMSQDTEWEVRVIHDPHTLNAFVLPGGKVFVFDGIFRVTRNEDGLAAVLGHEIAHNLAQHFGERQSSAMGTNLLMYSLLAMSYVVPPLFFAAAWFLPGMLDVVFEMPMSRVQESEADYIGLMIMAEACYDPREALEFWRRMDYVSKRNSKGDLPEWASTHPSQSDCKGQTSTFANMFMDALNRGVLVV
ncbi:Mitochondrial metalloendopeptidase OMA1 [Ceratocystis platani]|uniref:Mitochondrial metalloendopeptidase OMA1 n=1 Tax=Ceratocystis fimbriata f. sp. platani TaxID=88771 RepID=A0A0F8B134_CERFI|nr:Mitochondrial metalloendopeptidase OMA1 [Ceratocystis platani]